MITVFSTGIELSSFELKNKKDYLQEFPRKSRDSILDIISSIKNSTYIAKCSCVS